jgi:transcription factor IIIB 90 kDa subunit
MTRGWRPASICGAALLLAARMNNFQRSIEEIVQVVKIADTTLKKRLEEFKATPSGSLTIADFRNVWLEEEMDPPAFTKGREKEEERLALRDLENGENGTRKGKGKSSKAAKKGKRKRKRDESEEEEVLPAVPPLRQPLDPSILADSIISSALEVLPPIPLRIDDSHIDPALLQQSIPLNMASSLSNSFPPTTEPSFPNSNLTLPESNLIEETVSDVLADEVSIFLNNPQGTMLSEALDEAEQRWVAQISIVDDLLGLNEEELDRLILSEEEVKIKERVWVELNRDYLEAIAGRFTFKFSSFARCCFAQWLCFPIAKGDVENPPVKSKKVRISFMLLLFFIFLDFIITYF